MQIHKIVLGLFAFCFLLGCGKQISSANIKTESIYFAMAVQGPNSKTIECYTRGSVEDELGNSVEFAENDYLTCNGQRMERGDDVTGRYVYYTTRVPLTTDSRYEIRFYKSGQLYATSDVIVPQPISVQEPIPDFSVNVQVPLRVRWIAEFRSQSGFSAFAQTEGNDHSQAFQSPETGSMQLPLFQNSLNIMSSQKIVLKLKRETQGRRDGRLKGHIEAVQEVVLRGTLRPYDFEIDKEIPNE